MIRTALVVVCLFLCAGCVLHRGGGGATAPQQTDAATISVFVWTTPPQGRVLSGDEVARQRATSLIADSLKRRKGTAIATARAQADVLVEVHSAVSLFLPHTEMKFDENAILVDVRGAGQTTRLAESGYDRTRTAGKVAKDIDRWIRANRSKIVAARPPAK